MLILTRRVGETLMIGDDIKICVVKTHGNQVSLGITAHKDIPVHREEIYHKIQSDKLKNLQKTLKERGIDVS